MKAMENESKLAAQLMRESIFIVGRVLSVEGRSVRVRVNKNKNHSHIIYEGRTVKNVSVGSYVKIVKGFISIIGKVEGEFVREEKFYNQKYKKEDTRIDRVLQVSLFGHFENGRFSQGIKEMPLLDNECYVLDRDEFNALHHFHTAGEKTITLGALTEEPAQIIRLSINKLFASHIGIFGNTGSGKSNTLARIFSELFSHYTGDKFLNNSKFIIIDFNGEYATEKIITANKTIHKLSTSKKAPADRDKFPITRDDLSKTEILSVLLEATEKTQKPFLDRAVRDEYLSDDATFNLRVIARLERIITDVILKKDPNLRESVIVDLLKHILKLIADDATQNSFSQIIATIEGNLHLHVGNDFYWGITTKVYNNKEPIYDKHIKPHVDGLSFKTDIFSKLKLKIILNYYWEIITGYSNPEHIGPLLGRMNKKFYMLEKLMIDKDRVVESKNVVVVSLRDVNVEMKKIIPLIVCKQLYEAQKSSSFHKQSLHLIVDEAHNILSTSSQRESETWKDYRLETFEEIIKEGRKFSTFLTIASQRPYDISPTIISQLHNYFIHRLINDNDIQAVSKTVAYLDKLSFETIPILSVGSCFVAGLASDIPIKVDVRLLAKESQPRSETVKLSDIWN